MNCATTTPSNETRRLLFGDDAPAPLKHASKPNSRYDNTDTSYGGLA